MKRYGLIGYPLGHSFSQQYFTEKFAREGIDDCRFDAFPLPQITDFPLLLEQYPDLRGLSVTIPYKEQVLAFVHDRSDEVLQTGATNSIRIRDGRLAAFNTDITGFRISFTALLQPHHTRALILGSGGASKAVQYVLRELGIPFSLVSRSAAGEGLTYNDLNQELMEACPVIINTSPVGMFPDNNACPAIPYEWIGAKHYLYDLVYRPDPTLFLQKGAQQGALVKSGMDMLELQAEASWRIWNEIP